MADPHLVAPLLERLGDVEATVREQAAWALGQLGDRRATDRLLDAACDADSCVREAARLALTGLDLDVDRTMSDDVLSDGETVGALIASALDVLRRRGAGD
jgi:HEAT repeat protein